MREEHPYGHARQFWPVYLAASYLYLTARDAGQITVALIHGSAVPISASTLRHLHSQLGHSSNNATIEQTVAVHLA